MTLLLDTHVLLWWLDDHPDLSARAKEAIASPQNIVFVSVAGIWEIHIKQSLGKLKIPEDFKEILEQQPFETLPISAEHAHQIGLLPLHHRDPFDRMLVAQARVEGLTLVSRDVHLKKYNIKILEA